MKCRVWNLIIVTALLSVFSVASIFSPASPVKAATTAGDSKARRLEGTWRVEVTIRNCQTGEALRTFPAFLTFAQGGTLVETTTGFSPAMRSPGHGFWEHTGGDTFKAVSEAFLFNPAGVWVATQKLTQTIAIGNNPDELTSTATNEIFDTNGNLTTSGCATAIAHRLE